MRAYLVRRLLALLPTLFFASLIVFVTVRLIPGDVIDMMIAQNDIGSKTTRAALEAALGLDQPMFSQYLKWISGILLRADFGSSLWQQSPVLDEMLARLPDLRLAPGANPEIESGGTFVIRSLPLEWTVAG